MKAILALAAKDLRILLRVRSGLFFTFIWPVIVAILFGAVFSGQSSDGPRTIRVVIVDDDQSEGSKAFVGALERSGEFAHGQTMKWCRHSNLLPSLPGREGATPC